MSYKGRVCMAVGWVLIAVTNVYNKYSGIQHTDESRYPVYQCCTTSSQNLCFFGVKAGVFGVEASTPTLILQNLVYHISTMECTSCNSKPLMVEWCGHA